MFKKLVSNKQATKNGTSPYWDITSYLSNYKNLTISNFVVQLRGITQNGTGNSVNDGWTYSYDASTGRVTMYVPDTFGNHTPPYADIYYYNPDESSS